MPENHIWDHQTAAITIFQSKTGRFFFLVQHGEMDVCRSKIKLNQPISLRAMLKQTIHLKDRILDEVEKVDRVTRWKLLE
jgi:hypothetical protein